MKKLTALLILLAILCLIVPTPGQDIIVPKRRPAAGGGAPANFVNDTFTETTDTAYGSHTPELGGPVTLHPAYSAAATVDATSDRVYPTGTTAYFYNATPTSADQCVHVDFYAASIISVNISIGLRMSTTSDDMYLFQLNNGTQWRWIERLSGANGVLGAVSTSNLPSVGGFTTVEACVTGSNLTVSFNGVHDTSMDRSSTAITAAGRVGWRASGAASATTGFHLDNFSAR
jgi:hypothetical protein